MMAMGIVDPKLLANTETNCMVEYSQKRYVSRICDTHHVWMSSPRLVHHCRISVILTRVHNGLRRNSPISDVPSKFNNTREEVLSESSPEVNAVLTGNTGDAPRVIRLEDPLEDQCNQRKLHHTSQC